MSKDRVDAPNGVATNIRQLREARGWSREAAAELADIAAETLARIERDQHAPSLAVMIRLATLFGVSLDDLAGIARDDDDTPLVQATIRTVRRLDERRLKLAHDFLQLLERSSL